MVDISHSNKPENIRPRIVRGKELSIVTRGEGDGKYNFPATAPDFKQPGSELLKEEKLVINKR